MKDKTINDNYIIAIIGKTNSGKDTAAKYLHNKYGLDMVVSHTTRPMRTYETNGKEHWFDTKLEFDNFLKNNKIIAYTKNDMTGIEYAAVLSKEELSKNMIYIINPDGINWMHKNAPDINILSIYIDLNEEEIINRGIKRGDNIEVLKERLASERDEFNTFRDDIGADGWFNYNFLIYNDTLDNLYKGLDNIADIYGFKPISNEKKTNDVEEDIELC